MSKKKPYKKPEIKSEPLTAFGAACNGTTKGGRKASTLPPAKCNASKINS